nr:hypothetical protein [Tanacetum cinerariifolium]
EMTMKAKRMMKVMMEKMMMMMTKMMLKEMMMIMTMMMRKRLPKLMNQRIQRAVGMMKKLKVMGESEEEETREEEEESFDPILRNPEDSKDNGNGEENHGLRGRGLQVSQDIEDSHVTLTLVKPDGQQESSSVSLFVTSMLNPISDAGVESIFTTASSPIASLQTPTPIMTPSTIATITISSDAPIPQTTILSETNQFEEAVSNILGIVHQYMNQQMTKAVRESVQIQTDRLQDSFQRENDEFLRTIDENMKRIVKEQVKIAADLTGMELKKIPSEKMEGNKSIQQFDEQRNLYKALVDAYEADKTILQSYGDTAILKRRRGDDDDQEGP